MLKIEAACSSDKVIRIYKNMRLGIPEGINFQWLIFLCKFVLNLDPFTPRLRLSVIMLKFNIMTSMWSRG
jgi:hypothetical protein